MEYIHPPLSLSLSSDNRRFFMSSRKRTRTDHDDCGDEGETAENYHHHHHHHDHPPPTPSIRSSGAETMRRYTGEYYTPPEIAAKLAHMVIDIVYTDVGNPRIFMDPCCGDGSLLMALAIALEEVYPDKSRPDIALLLRGSDISQDALSLCHARLSEWCGTELPRENFSCGDALDDRTWREQVRPDIILTNPPWRTVGRHEVNRILRLFPEAGDMPGQLELSRVFLRKCCRMAREAVVILCAESIADGPNTTEDRRFLLTEGVLHRVDRVIFPRVSLDAVAISWSSGRPGDDGKTPSSVLIDGSQVDYGTLLDVPQCSLLSQAYTNHVRVTSSQGRLVYLGGIFPAGHSRNGDVLKSKKEASAGQAGSFRVWENKHIVGFTPLSSVCPTYTTNRVADPKVGRRIVLSRMVTRKSVKGTIAEAGEFVCSNTTSWFDPVGSMTLEALLAVLTSAYFRSMIPNATSSIAQHQLMRTPVPAADPEGVLDSSGCALLESRGSAATVLLNDRIVESIYTEGVCI